MEGDGVWLLGLGTPLGDRRLDRECAAVLMRIKLFELKVLMVSLRLIVWCILRSNLGS